MYDGTLKSLRILIRYSQTFCLQEEPQKAFKELLDSEVKIRIIGLS